MTKALEVTIDRKVIGIYVPPAGRSFTAHLESDLEDGTTLSIVSGPRHEIWYWNIDDIKIDSIVSIKMIETGERGVPPHRVVTAAEQQ